MAVDPITARELQNVIYDFKSIVTDPKFLFQLELVAQVMPGHYKSNASKLRRTTMQIEKLLKAYRKKSLEVDKQMPKASAMIRPNSSEQFPQREPKKTAK